VKVSDDDEDDDDADRIKSELGPQRSENESTREEKLTRRKKKGQEGTEKSMRVIRIMKKCLRKKERKSKCIRKLEKDQRRNGERKSMS